MQSLDDKIIKRISKRGRGTAFCASDFAIIGDVKSVSKALERLTNSKKIIRVARGIYCYPKIDKELGFGVLYPSFDEIAKIIAKRDKARIVPTGLYALNKLGLSTQVPMNIVYLTDGSSRKIKITNGRGILFKHTAPKNFAFQNEIIMLLTLALKEIGQEKVTKRHLLKIKEILQNEPKKKILKDLKLMPNWIRKIIINAYE